MMFFGLRAALARLRAQIVYDVIAHFSLYIFIVQMATYNLRVVCSLHVPL